MDHIMKAFSDKDLMAYIDIDCAMTCCLPQRKKEQLQELTTNAQRVRFAFRHLEKKDKFPAIYKKFKEPMKDDQKAKFLREKGNEEFKIGQFTAALKYYNESLCFALPGSESMSLAYANRAAIFLKTGFYKFCVENVELAMENLYPEKLKEKLMERKEEAQRKLMQEGKDLMDLNLREVELSYPVNSEAPFAADSIECIKNEETGEFHFVAKKDLKVGDTIILEEPLFFAIIKDASYSHCYHCGKNNYFNLKPSSKTTVAMFCSDSCAEEAWKKYFKFEYSIAAKVLEAFSCKDQTLIIRVALIALSVFDDPQKLKKFVEETEIKSNPLAVDFNTDEGKLKALLSLKVTKKKKDELKEFLGRIGHCAFIFHVLKGNEEFCKFFQNTEHEDTFLELLVKISHLESKKADRVDFLEKEKNNLKNYKIGSSFFISPDLLPHSCYPNTHPEAVDSLVVTVNRPIPAGETLTRAFNHYFFHYNSKEKRQKLLKDEFGIDCKCEACLKDFPMMDGASSYLPGGKGLRFIDIIPDDLQEKMDELRLMETFGNERYNLAKKIRGVLCEELEKGNYRKPCVDYRLMQASLYRCNRILMFKKPLNDVFVVKSD